MTLTSSMAPNDNSLAWTTIDHPTPSSTMITLSKSTGKSLIQLPHEMMELIFEFLSLSESFKMRLLNRTISSQFLTYFRRVLRERWHDENMASCYPLNEPPVSLEMISETEKKFHIIIPLILKELLMITNGSKTKNRFHLLPIECWYEQSFGVVFSENYLLVSDGVSKSHILVRVYSDCYSLVNFWDELFHSFFEPAMIDINKLYGKKCFEYSGFEWYDQLDVHLKTIPKYYVNYLEYMVSPNHGELRYNASKLEECLNFEFLQDEKFTRKVVSLYYKLVRHFPPHLLNNRNYCKNIVRAQGKALKYCPKFSEDREIVLTAVKSNGYALKYAHLFQSDPEIVAIALKTSPHVLQYVSKSTPNYKQFVLEALRNNKFSTLPKFFTEDMAQCKDYVEALLEKSPNLLDLMPKVWFSTQFLLKMMRKNPKSCKYIFKEEKSKKISLDKRNIKTALQLEPISFTYLSQDYQHDKELLDLAFGCKLSRSPENDTISNEGLKQIMDAIQKNPKLIRVVCLMDRWLSPMKDQDMLTEFLQQACKTAFSQNGFLLKYCIFDRSLLMTNQKVKLLAIEIACKQNPKCIEHLDLEQYCYDEISSLMTSVGALPYYRNYYDRPFRPTDKESLMKNIRMPQISI
ncbi:hypothetical protein FDP41_003776 [Naegleria fowleri]|uniref:F-box domain-containing protein n=1 Tax=Naegleria fowleri TaxID=5763 RepID=A0A6A5BGV3_NAEFO|nr:uncharacterized protein FDP41_003776 [Naegleria fowleri]KAF0977123.1 hypothetical protein FDP41_003776 [Naegleria fowleri]CAG4708497.1 unnamed protein product [Naegleria fowleri]